MSTVRKLYFLLNKRQRRATAVLMGLMFIGMVMETIGVGIAIPVLALMTQSDLPTRYPFLAPMLARLGNPSTEWLIIGTMVVLVGLAALKAVTLAFITWRQAAFVAELQVDLSQRLFSGYLRQPYTFHLQRNSADLIFNTNSQSGGVASVVQQSLLLLTEMLVLVGIAALLLAVEPLGAVLVVSIFGLAGWGFNRVSRSRVAGWGIAFQLHERQRIQHLQQGLGSAKDVKLLGREDDFLAQYRLHTNSAARVFQRQMTLVALPRLWLEMLAISALAVLVVVMVQQGKPMDAVLPTLGLFAAAAFRVMPSVNRVMGALQTVRFSTPVINNLHSELVMLSGTMPPRRGERISFVDALSLEGVNFSYAGSDAVVLRDLNLTIAPGSSVGFVGGSGAGKSTLVDIILGLLTPTGGTVKADGIDIESRMRAWQDLIGYVPQSIYLTDDTLRRNVAFGLPDEQIDEDAVWRAIRAAQLEEFVNELPDGLESFVGERGVRLSGGQRQRIGIARALYHDPTVLVLDEATSSLDTATERGVMEAVSALHGDKTLIIVAHRLSTIEHCDRVYRMERGTLTETPVPAASQAVARRVG